MNKTIEEIKEDAKVSAQAEVDEDLEDVSAAGDVFPAVLQIWAKAPRHIITSQETYPPHNRGILPQPVWPLILVL